VLIDWFTVIAQIVNFLVLVFLLKHFLYGRIITAMDAREERIASSLREAHRKEVEAEEQAEDYRRKKEEVAAGREEMLSRAKAEAESRKKELIGEAREEVDRMQSKWREGIRREKEIFLEDLKERVTDEVFRIARRSLEDLADVDIEHRIIRVFLDRIRKMPDEDWEKISKSLRDSDGVVVVRSAFEIPEDYRNRIIRETSRKTGRDIGVTFEKAPHLIGGIELKAHDHRVAWSIENHLTNLREIVSASLEEETRQTGGESSTEETEESGERR
jgi:F-type H+-transporting ATPase subunit b